MRLAADADANRERSQAARGCRDRIDEVLRVDQGGILCGMK